VPGGTST